MFFSPFKLGAGSAIVMTDVDTVAIAVAISVDNFFIFLTFAGTLFCSVTSTI